MTPPTPTIKATILRALDTESYEYGRSADLDEARKWARELEVVWPSLESVPDGKDIFEGKYEMTGDRK